MAHRAPSSPPDGSTKSFFNSPPTGGAIYSSLHLPSAPAPASVHVFTRHRQRLDQKTGKPLCSHYQDRNYRTCRCPKWVYVRHHGRNKEVSAKTRSWAEAERYARRLAETYDPLQQALQLARQDQQPKVKDLAEAMNEFLAVWSDDEKAEGTVAKLRTTLLKKFLPWTQRQTPPVVYLHQIEPEHIDQWKLQLRLLVPGQEDRKPSEVTKQSELQRIRTFLNYCMDKKWVRENVAVSRRRTRKRLKRMEEHDENGYIRDEEGDDTLPLTPEQFDALVEAADSKQFCSPARLAAEPALAERVKVMLFYTRYAGLRIGDAATSRKDRLKADNHLFLYTIKNQNPVVTLLPPHVASMLRTVPPGRQTHPDYFFWSKRSKPKSEVSNWVKKMADLREIAIARHPDLFSAYDGRPLHVHWHCLRDTFAVSHLEHGFTLEEVAALLGDTVEVTRKHYAKWSVGRQSVVAQKQMAMYDKEGFGAPDPREPQNVVSIASGRTALRGRG